MFFFFPSGTDAPLYHPPFATAGLVTLNILVFLLQHAFPDVADWFLLHHGSFNPIAWFTSCCMHADIGHLLGNMVPLFIFGWIIEGKVGWWRTLAMFFFIGAAECAFEQTLFLILPSPSGATLGASSAIFGFIAIALLWAPENNLTITYGGLFLIWPVWGTVEISIAAFCYIMIAIEFLIAWMTFFQLSSATLHLAGVVPGCLLGYFMLKNRHVDCEGYDLISIWQGKAGQKVITVAEEKQRKENKQRMDCDIEVGLQKVQEYIDTGHYELALQRFKMLRKLRRRLVMTEAQLISIVKAFDQDKSKRSKMIPVIQTYLQHYEMHAVALTLMMAKFHVLDQQRPRQALKVLNTLGGKALTKKQHEAYQRILQRAQRMISQGTLEVNEP